MTNPYRSPSEGAANDPRCQDVSGPTLSETAIQAIVAAFIIWTLLFLIIKTFVPIDFTGSPEGDARIPLVIAATAFGTVLLTAVHIVQWRRKRIRKRV